MLVIYLCLNIGTIPNLGLKDFVVDSNFTLNFYGKKKCVHGINWEIVIGCFLRAKSEGIST